MKKKTKKKTKIITEDDRVDNFLKVFSKEQQSIRDRVVKDISAYNDLLSLHALTWEDLSLKPIALQYKYNIEDPVFSYRSVKPPCIKCGATTNIVRKKENSYTCKSCGTNYTPNQNSITSNTNCSSLTWMKVLRCMMDFYPISRTCDFCNISNDTYYNIRNRIFYAMEIMMSDVKLYDVIQCDNTYVHLSYKGMTLSSTIYPEDSEMDAVNFEPRGARTRGGPHKNKVKNLNSVCIYTAIDNHGHVVTRYVGIGNATATKLERAVSVNKYLREVPDSDPFTLTYKKENAEFNERTNSLLVSDKEHAIIKYAEKIGLDNETHVFRESGKQLKLKATDHNIQRVNSLHSRLKTFLMNTGYVSSKYLPGFLVFFEFLENTGGTKEAISKLFDILVTKDLGQDKDFFARRYVAPNYIYEWQTDNVLLKKLSYNQVLSIYLYHKNQVARTQRSADRVTMNEILEQTGYNSSATIRRLYKNAAAAGVVDFIVEHFEQALASKPKANTSEHKKAKDVNTSDPQPPSEFALYVYDEFCKNLQGPIEDRISEKKLYALLATEKGVDIPFETMRHQLKNIEKRGFREVRLSELKKLSNARKHIKTQQDSLTKANLCLSIYQELCTACRRVNKPKPKPEEYLPIICERTGFTHSQITRFIWLARKEQKNKPIPD